MASPPPADIAERVTDAHFRLQRLRRTKAAALQLLRDTSEPSRPLTPPADAAARPPSSAAPSEPDSPLLPYLQYLQSLRWWELAHSTLSSAFASYHAAGILAVVQHRALQHEAASLCSPSSSSSPAICLHFLTRLHAHHREWAALERQRAALLHRRSYSSALQLSIIPPSPFPSSLLIESLTSIIFSSLSSSIGLQLTSAVPLNLPALLQQWTPPLQSLAALDVQQQMELRRVFASVLPPPEVVSQLPTLRTLYIPLSLPSSHSLLQLTQSGAQRAQLQAALQSWAASVALPVFPSSLTPPQYLDYLVTSSFPLSQRSAGVDADDRHFLLHVQPQVYAQLSAFASDLTAAELRPSAVSAPASGPLISPYVASFQQLHLHLCAQPTDSDDVRRVKSGRWMEHYQRSAVQRLVLHVQFSSARYADLNGGKVEQALRLHSDISNLLDLAQPTVHSSATTHPALSSTSYASQLLSCRTSLSSAIVEHCGVWLLEQLQKMFGRQLSTFPLVLAAFPQPLPRVEDFAQLFSAATAPAVSPYLYLYMHWLHPLCVLAACLHPQTGDLLGALVGSLHSALLAFLASLLHAKPKVRINGNGAQLLTREVDFVAWHCSLTLASSGSLASSAVSASLGALTAALHLWTHFSLYRASERRPHPPSKASVAPLPAPGEDETGVKLLGYSVEGWRDWLALYSSKHAAAWNAGMRRRSGEQGQHDKRSEEEDVARGCTWWRSNAVGVQP